MPRTIRKSVGIIGLGIIGRRIADHLRHQGLSVFVWNRTPKPVPNFVGSPSELAQTCNYLQIFVSDVDALKQNASNSSTLDLKVPQIIAADFAPHFSVKHMLKDMQIANRMGRHFDLDLTVAGATRDRLLDEARQGRGDDDYSSIARRFLPFVKTPDLEERQPDLFSPKPIAAVPNENPEFIEQQLAELEKTQIPVATFELEEIPEGRAPDLEPVETTPGQPDEKASPELEQEPVEMETPRQMEPAP